MAGLQAGGWAGSEAEYLKRILPKRLSTLFSAINDLVAQIDVATGKPIRTGSYTALCETCRPRPQT